MRSVTRPLLQSDAHAGRGFTVIEMSMAIIVLGIAFMMTLKGADLVQTARAFMSSYTVQRYQTAIKAYETTHMALPGDDRDAPKRNQRPPSIYNIAGGTVSFAGDGMINGRLYDVTNPNGEQFMAWRDLRIDGAIPGDKTMVGASAMPDNVFGGVYGIDEGNLGQVGGSICLTRVPGRAAYMIDRYLDDGVVNKGKVVATAKWSPVEQQNHFDAPDDTPYDFEKEYIICAPLLP